MNDSGTSQWERIAEMIANDWESEARAMESKIKQQQEEIDDLRAALKQAKGDA